MNARCGDSQLNKVRYDDPRQLALLLVSAPPLTKPKRLLPAGLKPYYEDEACAIILGDCREILPTLSFDVVVSNPPYGIDHPTDYANRGRGKLAVSRNYSPVIGDSTPFNPAFLMEYQCILWGANYYADKLPSSSGWLVWDKARPHDLDQATAELAWSNFAKGARIFRYLWNGMIRAGDDELTHPTQKPVALMHWCLTLKWTPAGVVCDPFMGSGTTLRAAKDLGRRAIGIEICEEYCEIAARRMSQIALFREEGLFHITKAA